MLNEQAHGHYKSLMINGNVNLKQEVTFQMKKHLTSCTFLVYCNKVTTNVQIL